MNLDKLNELLRELSAALVGHDWVGSRHTVTEEDLDGMYEFYLADGGYSRVWIDLWDYNPRISISSVSRESVKERWDEPHVRAIRDRILNEMFQLRLDFNPKVP